MPSPTDRIEKQVQLNAPLDRVWQALTDYKQFGEWFRVNLDGPFVPGEFCRGQITHPGYEHVTMEVKVGEIKPQTYFSFYWRPYAIDPQVDYSDEAADARGVHARTQERRRAAAGHRIGLRSRSPPAAATRPSA